MLTEPAAACFLPVVEHAPDRLARALAPQITARLEAMILDGTLPPGERLHEQALADRLGTSRGPLREALRALEREGLVVSGGAHRGMAVRRLEAQEEAELYDARALLQGFTCALLAERRTDAGLAVLDGRVADMDAAIAAGDADAYYRQNLDFHEAMLELAGHARTAGLYRSLVKESLLTRRRTLASPANMRDSNAEHRAMVDAIRARDADTARRLGEAHVKGGKRRWLGGL